MGSLTGKTNPKSVPEASQERDGSQADEASRLAEALQFIYGSQTFSRAEQLKGLIAYLRSAVLQNDPSLFTEYAIGKSVFRRKDFDPRMDTIVRSQMLRLRKKLDEYYQSEGVSRAARVVFDKKSYQPRLELNIHPVLESPRTETKKPGFWTGLIAGLAIATIVLVVLFIATRRTEIPSVVANHAIWARFRSSQVTVAIATPLFFRSGMGIERDFRLNLPDDLDHANALLLRQPVAPQWDRWAPFDDVLVAPLLDRQLRALHSIPTFVSARQISLEDLRGRKIIVLGHPRGAPFLYDALRMLNFHPFPRRSGSMAGGFENVHPRPSESASYGSTDSTAMEQSDESTPDFVLLTILSQPGGELMSLFGNRIQTSALLLKKLVEPNFLEYLNEKVFNRTGKNFASCQIVLRVDYARGTPTGAVYLTDRVTR